MTGHSVEQAIRAVREGRMVVLADDEARESEGVLALAAERVTPEAVNFMAREARGIVCVALPGERLEALRIPVMVPDQPASGDIKGNNAIGSRWDLFCDADGGLRYDDRRGTSDLRGTV